MERIAKRGNPEGQIQLQIIHYLKNKGYTVGKTKTKGSTLRGRFLYDVYQFRGFPDLVVFTPKFYFIEVKAPGGVQSPEQKHFEELCKFAGIPYILARRVDDVVDGIK